MYVLSRLHSLQDVLAGWYDMHLAKIDQFISNEAFLFFISQMCFERLMLSCYFFTLNEKIWFLYLSLTELDARPIYSALSSEQPGPVFDITSALYIIDFDKHSPRRGQECSPFLQL